MFIQSRTPDKIPDLYLWYDFSDRTTFNGGTISNGDTIGLVRNKAYQNVTDLYGNFIAGATNLCCTYSYTNNPWPLSGSVISMTAGDNPTWIEHGINGLGSVFFGGNTSSKGYSNVLTTSFAYQWNVMSWDPEGGFPPVGPDNYIGPISDTERSIFIVYVNNDTSGYNDNINAVDMYGTSVMGTQLPETGNFGCIFDIHAPIYNWLQNDDTQTSWFDQVSYLNLIKYQDSTETSILNFLPDQGFTMSYGYPANDPSGTYKVMNNTGYSSLFQFRSRDDVRGYYSHPTSEPVADLTKTHVSVSNMNADYYRNLRGVVCTSPDNGGFIPVGSSVPPNFFTGIWYGHLSLGNSSRFWNSVPSDSGMVAGVNIPAVDSTYQSGFNGYIGEVIYYNRRLTDLETKHVREYLNKKWNIGLPPTIVSGYSFYVDASLSYSSGRWTDLSGSGVGVTISGYPVFDDDGGGSLVFNGIDQYGYFDYDSIFDLSGGSGYCQESWVKFTDFDFPMIPFSKGLYGVDYDWGIHIGELNGAGDPSIISQFSNSTGNQLTATLGNPLLVDTWYHLCVSGDSTSTSTIYINGVAVVSGEISITNFETFGTVGCCPGYGPNNPTGYGLLKGKISINRLYPFGLTPYQVLNNFNADKKRFGY
jgi:hypothetical protein